MDTLWTNKRFIKISTIFIAVLSICAIVLLFKIVSSDNEGSDSNQNTISFSGHGEVQAVPDIANVYFTISQDGKTVKEAQDKVAVIEGKALDVLKKKNVAEKDIKTTNASFYPKYEYQYGVESIMPCNQYSCPPRPGKNVITGYTASESINVKIRNVDDAGEIMQALGATGASDLSGPDFSIDKEDALKAEARQKAIDDAKAKAKELAKELGVRLGKISGFNESGNFPIMYSKAEAMTADSGVPAPAQLPKGENTISSDVTITYEIR